MPKYFKYVLLLGLIAGIYFYRYEATRPIYKEGDRVRVTSRISEDPSIEGYQQKISLEGLKIYTDRFPEYSYGDYLIVEGEVGRGRAGLYLKNPRVLPHAFSRENPTSEASLRVESLWRASPSNGFLTLRKEVLDIYMENLPEPHNGLLSGIVLGTKSSLDAVILEKLRNTGTIHIVVASGTNITIFAAGIIFLATNIVGRRRAIIISLAFIWVYIYFIGFQPPIVRAGIMGSIAFTAQIIGREGSAFRALLVSGVLMLLVVPSWLFDLGFQLSFLATLGIILLGGKITGLLERFRQIPRLIRETLAMTIAAQVAVLPLIYYKFGSFPLISPLVNILVVPMVPFIMACGFILGLVSLAIPPIAKYIAWFVWIPLEYFVRVIEIFS